MDHPIGAAPPSSRYQSRNGGESVPRATAPAAGIVTKLRERADRLFFLNSGTNIPERMVRHAIGGGVATLLYMMLVALQVELFSVHPVLAIVGASIIMEVFIYFIQRFWVYESTREHKTAIPRFLATIPLALALNAGIMALVVDVLGHWYVWGLVATTLIVPPTNFLLNLYWVYR